LRGKAPDVDSWGRFANRPYKILAHGQFDQKEKEMPPTLVIAFLISAATGGSFVSGLVPNEAGFEGAVTVVSEEVEDDYGIVTVEVPYLDVYGEPKKGLARLVVHRKDVENGKPIPAFCHVHYEKDVGGAKKWAERGWMVTTAAYNQEYPIDAAVANGNNQARAIIQWVRRLPFIDRNHLHIDGGSQGGYMALAMSAEFLPVTSTTADAPVVNWAYNLNYFEVNKPVSGYPDKLADSPLPVMAGVTLLADTIYNYFGNELSADAYYWMSPISYLKRIGNPVLLVAATGDMLVPMEQMTRTHLHPYEKDRFPEGYQRDFDSLTLNDRARKTFEELVPEEKRFTYIAPLQEKSFELTYDRFKDKDNMPKERPETLDRSWSKDRQWSLFYLDEGPPSPEAPHTTYFWNTSPDSFVSCHREKEPSPDILNEAKLDRLMQRYQMELEDLPLLKEGKPANRLSFAGIEKRDVVQGLIDFASMSPEHEKRLVDLYANLEKRPLGEKVDLNILQEALLSVRPK